MGDKPRLTAVGPGEPGPPANRSRSSISFPYADLAEVERAAQEVAAALGRCHPDQLAAWLGHAKVDSGAFRNKLAAGKLFRVLSAGPGKIELTGLGRRLVDRQTAPQARVEALLSVPLYLAIFQAHRGASFPGNLGLELEMVRLGVARTQVKGARQVFVRSARHARLLEGGGKQLILPKGTVLPAATADPLESDVAPGGRYPKVIEAILEQAPWGEGWSEPELDEWSKLLVQAVRVHFGITREGGSS